MATQAPTAPRAVRRRPRREGVERSDLVLRCAGCGDAYPAGEGAAVLFALKSSCPRCGGSFRLVAP